MIYQSDNSDILDVMKDRIANLLMPEEYKSFDTTIYTPSFVGKCLIKDIEYIDRQDKERLY